MARQRFHVSLIRLVALLMASCVAAAQCMPVWALSPDNTPLPSRLNLSSTHKTVTAPQSLSSPLTILNGAQSQAITAGMGLTPAQLVAVLQVLSSGTQSLVLNTNGGAVGGSMVLQSSQNFMTVKVPHNVTVAGDFSNGSTLVVDGNFNNAGAFYAVSSNPAVSNAVVSAQNITNNAGGLITTVLPSSGLSNFANALPNLSLSLIATNLLRNAGTISSAKGLNLVAGNQIINSGTAGAQAVLSAAGNINIGTQVLSNSGLVQSSNANVVIVQQVARNAELAALSAQLGPQQGAFVTLSDLHDLLIDNTGGVIEALNGSIVVDHGGAQKGTTVTIVGGDLLSQTVDVNAGSGQLVLNVNNLTGVLNITGGDVFAGDTAGSLALGNMNIAGDPTVWSGGDITFAHNGMFSAHENVACLANGNIDLDNFHLQAAFDSIGGIGKGANITLVAGANLVAKPAPPPATQTVPQFPSIILPGQTVKLTGPSTSGQGGHIICSACILDARGVVANQNGGNILLAAYKGLASGSGSVDLENSGTTASVLETGIALSSTSGQAGAITIIAANLIRVDNVFQTGVKAGTKFTATTAQPTGTLTADSFGNVKGSLSPSKSLDTSGHISLLSLGLFPGLSNFGGIVTLLAGNTINEDSGYDLLASGINGLPPGAAGGKGGTVSITAPTIACSGIINAGGAAGAAGSTPSSAGASGGVGGNGGIGGTITIKGTNVATVGGIIVSDGGGGGDGGDAGPAGSFNSFIIGGTGGNGGAGGKAGKISVTGTTMLRVSDVIAEGGAGGKGGAGGDGASGIADGEPGGNSGKGGKAGNGGSITISAGTTSVLALSGLGAATPALPNFSVNGGDGGLSKQGGGGGSGNLGGGSGGASQNGGSGGAAGKLSITGGSISYTTAAASNVCFIQASGGAGGATGTGGSGGPGAGTAGNGASGGASGASGAGGAAGSITMSAKNGDINAASSPNALALEATGGIAGQVGGGGSGGSGPGGGGSGGDSGTVGAAGKGGKISISAPLGNITTENGALGDVFARGGTNGALLASTGGAGGTGGSGSGGSGGDGGKGGAGGRAGSINISAQDVTPGGLSVIGGFGSPGGSGGAGAQSTSGAGNGGNGGNGGTGGGGGKAGKIKVTASNTIDLLNILTAFGGSGGRGGNGGSAQVSSLLMGTTGGNGGNGGAGGNAGTSGSIILTAKANLTFANILESVVLGGGFPFGFNTSANGGRGGIGGPGGSGSSHGGNGGNGGNSGSGASAGSLTATATNIFLPVGARINALGGGGGGFPAFGLPAAPGGLGGTAGSLGIAGNGGNGGSGGNSGNGGKVTLKGNLSGVLGLIDANGGINSTPALTGQPGGIGGQGGDAGTPGRGGNGGNGGNAGNGGTVILSSVVSQAPLVNAFPGGAVGAGGLGGNLGAGPSGSAGTKAGTDGKIGKVIIGVSDCADEDSAPYKRPARRGGKGTVVVKVAGGAEADPGDENPLKPVAFVEPMLGLCNRQLPAANVLLAADRNDLDAAAGRARVHVARGASAFVVNNGRDVTVLSLHEHASSDVCVLVGGERINLCTGEQVVITSSDCDLADINPTAGIAVRSPRECRLAHGMRAITCEFSIASAISNLDALRRLAHSPDGHDRVVFSKLLKNAAVLQTMTAGKGPYKAYQPSAGGGQAI